MHPIRILATVAALSAATAGHAAVLVNGSFESPIQPSSVVIGPGMSFVRSLDAGHNGIALQVDVRAAFLPTGAAVPNLPPGALPANWPVDAAGQGFPIIPAFLPPPPDIFNVPVQAAGIIVPTFIPPGDKSTANGFANLTYSIGNETTADAFALNLKGEALASDEAQIAGPRPGDAPLDADALVQLVAEISLPSGPLLDGKPDYRLTVDAFSLPGDGTLSVTLRDFDAGTETDISNNGFDDFLLADHSYSLRFVQEMRVIHGSDPAFDLAFSGTLAVIPEPGDWAALGGLGCLGWVVWRKRHVGSRTA